MRSARDGWAADFTTTTCDSLAVGAIADELVPYGSKGLPLDAGGSRVGDLAARGIDLFSGAVPTPILALREDELEHNIEAMAAYCRAAEAMLAPHGKTTMAPQIMARQIDAGAWAMTAATPAHCLVYRRFGIQRIFLANQLVGPAAIGWLCSELARDPGFELFCLVDSVDGVELLDRELRRFAAPRPLPVLVEVGCVDGRAGARGLEASIAVARAARSVAALELVGVECFEGLFSGPATGETLARVSAYLDQVATVVRVLCGEGLLPRSCLVSAGGSAYFDLVVERLGSLPAQLVLRSGCYVTQDGGYYDQVSPLGGRAAGEPVLRNAIELWATVISRPEPEYAILDFGKRDAPYDFAMPTPRVRASPAGGRFDPDSATVVRLSDQHAHLSLAPGTELQVGERLGFGISHPCGAFDRWRAIPLVDGRGVIADVVLTFF